MQSGGVKCSNGDEGCMSFTILGSGIKFIGGYYKAKSFSVAAGRAGKKLFQKIDKDPDFRRFKNKTSIKFVLGEKTKGSDKKTKAYITTREELDKPKVVKIAGKEIKYKYKYSKKMLKIENSSTTLSTEEINDLVK